MLVVIACGVMDCVCLTWWVVLWCLRLAIWFVCEWLLFGCLRGVVDWFWCFGGLRRFVFFLDGGLDVSV